MASLNINLPNVNGDGDSWGTKNNAALSTIAGEIDTTGYYRRYVNGAWQVRGTNSPNTPRIWIKHDTNVPNPPQDNTYFKAGVDLLFASAGT